MHTLPTHSDRRFLRLILLMLVASTIVTGAIATSAAVMTGQNSIAPDHLIVVGR